MDSYVHGKVPGYGMRRSASFSYGSRKATSNTACQLHVVDELEEGLEGFDLPDRTTGSQLESVKSHSAARAQRSHASSQLPALQKWLRCSGFVLLTLTLAVVLANQTIALRTHWTSAASSAYPAAPKQYQPTEADAGKKASPRPDGDDLELISGGVRGQCSSASTVILPKKIFLLKILKDYDHISMLLHRHPAVKGSFKIGSQYHLHHLPSQCMGTVLHQSCIRSPCSYSPTKPMRRPMSVISSKVEVVGGCRWDRRHDGSRDQQAGGEHCRLDCLLNIHLFLHQHGRML